MKILTCVKVVILLAVVAFIWGCGSGGNQAPTSSNTKKSVSLGAPVSGIEITLILPPGVTVKADLATGKTLEGVVTVTGPNAGRANSASFSKYTPASGGVPGKVKIGLMSDTAFVAGEFFTVVCDVAAEATATDGSFGYEDLVLYDVATGIPRTAADGVSATITL